MPEYPLFKALIFKTLRAKVVPEYRFHHKRRWKFDYAVPDLMIAIEIEGGTWIKGRHNRAEGYQKDMEKYNMAQLMGWKVLRYTPEQVGECVRDLETIKRGLK